MTHEGFTAQHRAIGRISAWGVFIVGWVYGIAVSLKPFIVKPSQDPVGDPFLPIITLSVILTAPFMVACMVAVHAYASSDRKVYSAIALVFMTLAVGITSTANFAVFVVGHRVEMAGSPLAPLFLPYKWPTVAYALDTLAWDWFFGLSMLSAAPVFNEGRLERTVQILMVASGVSSIVGLIVLPFAELPAIILQVAGYGVIASFVFLLLARIFGRAHPVRGTTEQSRGALPPS